MNQDLLQTRIDSLAAEIPSEIEALILELGSKSKFSSLTSNKIAKSVLQASDFYIRNPAASTPWDEEWMQIAQIYYFLPLNYVRCLMVCDEAHRLGFLEGLKFSYDFGAGFAAGSLALQTVLKSAEPRPSIDDDFTKNDGFDFKFFDTSQIPSRLLKQALLNNANAENAYLPGFSEIKPQQLAQSLNLEKLLILSSYSMTELAAVPSWMMQAEALMIVEPSTQQDGRKLMQTRQNLIDAGFTIWGPCPHQQACPLLTLSKTDWCHDRIHLKHPKCLQEIETHLPMKNRTITWSYLLARKSAPPEILKTTLRTVGDQLVQKGKTRQLICRGAQREYLSWMHRNGDAPNIPRGLLLKTPTTADKVSDELRITVAPESFKF
ncbi:MAG: small ribosomal subunit Rsm22 family protein [Pseudobdellovibrionaceae bacterium]